MKNSIRFVSLIIIANMCISTSHAMNKKNISKASSSTCDSYIKSIRNIRSIDKIIAANKKAGQKTINQCMSKIKSDRKLKTHLTALIKTENRARKTANKQLRSKSIINSRHLNKEIEQIKNQAKRFNPPKMLNSRKSKSKDQNKRTAPIGRPLSLAKIISRKVVPGLRTWIDANGHHFGAQRGTVQLSVSNKTFPVEVLSWSNDWISVEFPNNIEGVYQTNNSKIKVTPINKPSVTISKPFTPYIVLQRVWDSRNQYISMNIFDMFNNETISYSEKIFIGASLQKQWEISSNTILPPKKGSCNKGTPYMTNGGKNLESSLKLTYQRNSWVTCMVNVSVRGPKGTTSGVEDLNQL